MHRSLCLIVSLAAVLAPEVALAQDASSATGAAPEVVVPRVRVGPNINEAVQTRFDDRLRQSIARHMAVVDRGRTEAALTESGQTAAKCVDATCARQLAEASGARFVVTAHITNVDEIYTATLALYDAGFEKVTATRSESCELCAIDEVGGTMDDAADGLAEALAAAAPAPKPAPAVEPPVAPGLTAVEIITDPALAEVEIDGVVEGKTPLTISLDPGPHIVVFRREGYEEETRAFEVGAEKGLVESKLRVVAVPEARLTEPTRPMRGGASYAALGWVLTVTGGILTGIGAWLIVVDGETTCDDGRGRTTCPTVHDTKKGGLAAIGIGATALGSGITLLVVDPGNVPARGDAEAVPNEPTVRRTAPAVMIGWTRCW